MWWFSGGCALDLFAGHHTREHGDVDVSLFRDDAPHLRRLLQGWDLRLAHAGVLTPWGTATIEPPFGSIWCRPTPEAPLAPADPLRRVHIHCMGVPPTPRPARAVGLGHRSLAGGPSLPQPRDPVAHEGQGHSTQGRRRFRNRVPLLVPGSKTMVDRRARAVLPPPSLGPRGCTPAPRGVMTRMDRGLGNVSTPISGCLPGCPDVRSTPMSNCQRLRSRRHTSQSRHSDPSNPGLSSPR